MQIELGFGAGVQSLNIPDKNLLGVLTPNPVEKNLTGEAEVRRALENPIGTPQLKDIVKPGEKIAVITSDITRPMPTYKVMPPCWMNCMQRASARRISPLSSRWAAIESIPPKSRKSFAASVHFPKSPASTAMRPTAYTSAKPAAAPR